MSENTMLCLTQSFFADLWINLVTLPFIPKEANMPKKPINSANICVNHVDAVLTLSDLRKKALSPHPGAVWSLRLWIFFITFASSAYMLLNGATGQSATTALFVRAAAAGGLASANHAVYQRRCTADAFVYSQCSEGTVHGAGPAFHTPVRVENYRLLIFKT
jgi:hypothetical protein